MQLKYAYKKLTTGEVQYKTIEIYEGRDGPGSATRMLDSLIESWNKRSNTFKYWAA